MEQTKKWTILTAILGVLFVAALVTSNAKASAYDKEIRENKTKLTQAEQDLEGLQKQLESPPTVLTKEEQEQVLHSASEAGNAVAELQNAYQSTGTDGIKDIADKLDGHLADGSKNARVPWFDAKTSHTWTFLSDGTFSGEQAEVVWVCKDGEGSFLAFAKGVYDNETGLFDNVYYQLSRYGSSLLGSSGDQSLTGEIDTGKVNDMAEDIGNADVPDAREQTDEELTEASEAREKLKKAMEKGE